MLSTPEFATWSRRVVLFLHNTSRVADEPHPNLLFELGGIGFPTVSYLDADGSLLKQVGHVTPIEELEAAFVELQRWKALRDEVQKGADASRQKDLFLLELAMGNRPFAEMVERRKAFDLTGADRATADQQLVNLQFTEILRRTPRDRQAEGGEQFLAMFRQARIPTTTTETSFWQYMFAFAEAKGDVPLFEELLGAVQRAKAGDPRLERYLGQLREQLDRLKAAKGRPDGR